MLQQLNMITLLCYYHQGTSFQWKLRFRITIDTLTSWLLFRSPCNDFLVLPTPLVKPHIFWKYLDTFDWYLIIYRPKMPSDYILHIIMYFHIGYSGPVFRLLFRCYKNMEINTSGAISRLDTFYRYIFDMILALTYITTYIEFSGHYICVAEITIEIELILGWRNSLLNYSRIYCCMCLKKIGSTPKKIFGGCTKLSLRSQCAKMFIQTATPKFIIQIPILHQITATKSQIDIIIIDIDIRLHVPHIWFI